MTDAEILTTPGQQPGAEAWLNLALSIGKDVASVAEDARRRRRHALLPKAPVFAAEEVPSSGTVVLDLGAPMPGREWQVRRLLVADLSNPTGITAGGEPTFGSNTFDAATAGAVGLAAGSSMSGFDITSEAAAAVVSGAVTVLNVGASNPTYELVQTTTGGTLSVRFPTPLPAVDSASFPQVSVPAIVGGAAYAVTVYGTTPTTGATPGAGAWYIGVPTAYGAQGMTWPVPQLPAIVTKGGEHITVPAREHLFAVLTGCTEGHVIVARADIIDDVPGHAAPVQSV